MTVNQAKEVLQQAGESPTSKDSLRALMNRVYDPMIKRACEKLLITLLWPR